MIDVLQGLLVACGFATAGFLIGDWRKRSAEIQTAKSMMVDAHSLVDQYKAHLARLHEVDLTRAQAIADLLRRTEAIETRHEMSKINRERVPT